ncbi:abscisic acid receptor PYL9-like [Hordeum vulgare subsp. vulgare]|uniref:Uncharacterized protein n=1 Tax=Hordeum vulgare subsp. vulgare TaxID=112509 RepID=A0A8I6X006_HORVV|nr:abscisic acid receptor PYL9-like [Hordeum vulgare subsp. vulgare]
MSLVAQRMPASGCAAWPIVRNFGNPQRYTHFVRTSALVAGDEASIGKAWEDTVVSGLPTSTSSERLEILDDGRHILSFSIVDGEHCLCNYRSVSSVTEILLGPYRAVVESYVVPDG